ncbi:hypothetical protein BKH42_04485 [Helicobacter sp. 13S00482-2]|uniref:MlaD family protein n=1 Tax=Helicobacter sp. 13S00482-2 TaxID=1476200 RepID=UPI000BA58E00|nr:MlaD family protein [Helicobacter sp. 13S00482-2]PAF53758.1 hypothetical protein BKH42_04485 [Helicobacter sp. 13S00482-2]
MERNINYTVIGSVFFAVVVCMVIFIFWIGRIGVNDNKYQAYEVYTDNEISGITINTPVKYKGITIGSVSSVSFDKDRLGTVKIGLNLLSNIPIHKNSFVTPNSEGLAGLGYLALEQSDDASFVGKDDPHILNFKQNFMGKIASQADEVTKELLGVLKNIKDLTDTENIKSVSNIIKSLDSLSETLVQTKDEINRLSKNSNLLLSNINHKLESGEYDVKQMLNPVVIELERSLKSMNQFFQKGSGVIDNFDSNPYNTLFGVQK